MRAPKAYPGNYDSGDGTRPSYVLKWYHGDEPRYSWFIRGIKADRTFYGEVAVRVGNGGKSVNASGKLSEADYSQLLSLINEIESYATIDDSDMPCVGLLAEGPVHRPRIIFKYRNTYHPVGADLRFLEIIEVLERYLHKFYELIE